MVRLDERRARRIEALRGERVLNGDSTRAIATQIVPELYPAALQGMPLSASAVPLRDETVGRVEALLYVLFAAVAVVLLSGCADIANLMLTRAAARQRETAVRAALGAGRARLLRQGLVESMVLAGAGAAAGLLLARWASAALVSVAPPTLPRLDEVALDVRVLGFTAIVSVVTAPLCGLLPAWELSRRDSADTLKEGGRTAADGRRHRRIFGTLVTAQFALAVVLLVAGGLLIRSFLRLTSVDPGFRAEHVLTLATNLPAAAYPGGAEVWSFYVRLIDALQQLPGVAAPEARRRFHSPSASGAPSPSRSNPTTLATCRTRSRTTGSSADISKRSTLR